MNKSIPYCFLQCFVKASVTTYQKQEAFSKTPPPQVNLNLSWLMPSGWSRPLHLRCGRICILADRPNWPSHILGWWDEDHKKISPDSWWNDSGHFRYHESWVITILGMITWDDHRNMMSQPLTTSCIWEGIAIMAIVVFGFPKIDGYCEPKCHHIFNTIFYSREVAITNYHLSFKCTRRKAESTCFQPGGSRGATEVWGGSGAPWYECSILRVYIYIYTLYICIERYTYIIWL